jgi:hypothetical protein
MKPLSSAARSLLTLALVAGSVAFASTAEAATITFTNAQVAEGGTGFGSVNNLLALSNTPTEYGSVTWNGSSAVLGGHATNASEVQTTATILNGTSNSDIALIFNIAEPGSDTEVVLHDFNLLRFNSAGVLQETITWNSNGGLTLSSAGQGVGRSGWLFRVTGADLSNGTDVWGMEILSNQSIDNSITQTAGAAESFYVTSLAGDFVVTPVPLPPAAWMGLGLLGALGVAQHIRRRRAAAAI